MKKIALMVIALALAGCSTYGARQQQMAQENRWEQIGLLDGQAGLLEKSTPELMQLGKMSDSALAEYSSGYRQGITEFCQPGMAFERGLSGAKYKDQCVQQPNEQEVIKRWLDGTKEHRKSELMRIHSKSESEPRQ